MYQVPVEVDVNNVVECFLRYVMPNARPQWTKENIRLSKKKFDGGYSNQIIGICQDQDGETDDEPDIVLFRISSLALSSFFVDREVEVKVMELLHKAGLNPPVYCQFNNAVCYGYTPGRALKLDDLGNSKILKCIAVTMARYHSLDHTGVQGKIWVDEISAELPESFPNDEITAEMEKSGCSFQFLKQEFESAKTFLKEFKCPKALCHNDVHVLNMIYDERGEKVVFIDQEAAGLAHVSCEIGNFFRYFVGIFENLDFNRYPSEVVQKEFIRMYLEEKYRLEGKNADSISSDEIHSLYMESRKGAVVQILMEMLVLVLIIDGSRNKGLHHNERNLQFLKLQFEHYNIRKNTICPCVI